MLFFSGLSIQLKPIIILLRICPYGSEVLKNIFLSSTGTLNNTFLVPFLFAYQSFILSIMLVVDANFSIYSTSLDVHLFYLDVELEDPFELIEPKESNIFFNISLF